MGPMWVDIFRTSGSVNSCVNMLATITLGDRYSRFPERHLCINSIEQSHVIISWHTVPFVRVFEGA